jgi:hypothetical protein
VCCLPSVQDVSKEAKAYLLLEGVMKKRLVKTANWEDLERFLVIRRGADPIVVCCLPTGEDVIKEAKEYLLLEGVTKKQLVKTANWQDLECFLVIRRGAELISKQQNVKFYHGV